MAIPIPSSLVEFILLGPLDDRRQLQDSPILGDVWVEFGKRPSERVDLLIAPFRGKHAGSVGDAIDKGIPDEEDESASIAFLQGLVVACLTFKEVIRVVVPKTKWWISRRNAETKTHDVTRYIDNRKDLLKALESILGSARSWNSKTATWRLQELPSIERFLVLTGLILWAGSYQKPKKAPKSDDPITYILDRANENLEAMSRLLIDLVKEMLKDQTPDPIVWQVSRNRGAMPAISKSVPAVKADAATTLFKVNCSEIGWAVIDSGIDGAHPAFCDGQRNSRVKGSFDFKNFRKIVSLSNSRPSIRAKNVQALLEHKETLANAPSEKEADEDLKRLADYARSRGPVNWELVEKFVKINHDVQPPANHGTHVAGILGASRKAAEENAGQTGNPDLADGMCPDISLYDFRVLG